MRSRTTNTQIIEQLSQHARRLQAAQKLPPEGALPWEAIERVKSDLAFLCEQPGATIEAVSRAMGRGYSVTTLKAFKGATSRADLADIDRVARGINRFIETIAQRNEARRPQGFVETEVARRMLTVIETASRLAAIGLVYSDAGRGKSMTLEAASMLHPGSILVRVRHATRTPSGLAKHLAGALQIRGVRTTQQAEERLIDTLKGTGRLLLIDEAHQLKHDALEFIRGIHDETGCPVVLVGTVRVAEACDDHSGFFGQMSSRIAIRYDVTEALAGGSGGDPLHSPDEIARLFESEKLRLTADGRSMITRIANLPGLGGLRLCDRILKIAASLAGGEAIDAAVVRKVVRSLHGKTFAVSRIERAIERAIEQSNVKVA